MFWFRCWWFGLYDITIYIGSIYDIILSILSGISIWYCDCGWFSLVYACWLFFFVGLLFGPIYIALWLRWGGILFNANIFVVCRKVLVCPNYKHSFSGGLSVYTYKCWICDCFVSNTVNGVVFSSVNVLARSVSCVFCVYIFIQYTYDSYVYYSGVYQAYIVVILAVCDIWKNDKWNGVVDCWAILMRTPGMIFV